MKLTNKTTLFFAGIAPTAVTYALQGLSRDLAGIFGHQPVLAPEPSPDQIRIAITPGSRAEAFTIRCDDDSPCITIEGSDDLGAVFGIYAFCERWLCVDPFQFWTDHPYQPRDEIDVPLMEVVSPDPEVRFRGWFINDEDCLMAWHDDMIISPATWQQIFETMLRAGFNLVIPGTGSSADAPQLSLAADMGLWLTQHHAEPLGARLFSDAYPGIEPRIPEEMERFTALYREAVQLQTGRKVIWALGFRGQGDIPFFKSDLRYSAPQAIGRVISDIIRLQKKLVMEHAAGPHYFMHNVYSESAQLYREGFLELDDDIIRVWSDNGFGAMRARREWGTDPHILSLPLPVDRGRLSGVYYHVSFHDLQLSSKLTPIVSPELIGDQFRQLFASGSIQFLMLNVSNIRPHVFNIDLIRKLTRFPGEHFSDTDQPVEAHYAAWTHTYFPGFEAEAADLIARYHRAPFRYGPYVDDLAGEQVCHHGLRNAINAIIAGENVLDWDHSFHYIADPVAGNLDCFQWLLERAEATLPVWGALQTDAAALFARLEGYPARYFTDSIGMQIDYMAYSYQGFVAGLKGLIAYLGGDYKSAFCWVSRSKWLMKRAWHALAATEHDKWKHFFRGDWLTGTRETIRRLETLQGVCKIQADVALKDGFPAWIREALGFDGRSGIHTIIQAVADYDALAAVLLKDDQDPRKITVELLSQPAHQPPVIAAGSQGWSPPSGPAAPQDQA